MKVKVNLKEYHFPAGTRLARVVENVREANRDDPVSKSLTERTGHDHLTFVHNGRVVKPGEYDSVELKEGDEIRWMHPYAGG